MLNYDDEENDMFYDSVDRLSSEDSSIDEAELSGSYNLGYEIWANEPPCSVHERRKNFLQQMGLLAEFGSEEMGLDRLVDCSEAVSRCSVPSTSDVEEALDCCRMEKGVGEADSMCNELDGLPNVETKIVALLPSEEESPKREECQSIDDGTMRKKTRSWWKWFVNKRKEKLVAALETPEGDHKKVKVVQKKKRCLELTAPYIGQEIAAHKGAVWTIKFSPDGQYLASGGEDGVVRVWHVTTVDASSDYLTAEGSFCSKLKEKKFGFQRKHSVHASVIFPNKIFRIDEYPIQEFHGHSSDVLDLAWSNSNCILSSSKDKTVRLWRLGCDKGVDVFCHNNYVTCIQFNPVDDSYFISGSIDGKVRIWGLSEKRVIDWTDIRDVITAICYQPDGKGFIVGSVTGTCRSYRTSGQCMLLDTQINIPGRKRTSGNKITGIKFSHDKPQRVLISSEDSKLRIFDGVDLTHKYKGLPKSGSQMSASFTSGERHIVSVGDDSRVYVWNYDSSSIPSSKQMRSVRSCEHFFYRGMSVAIPWPGAGREQGSSGNAAAALQAAQGHLESTSWTRDSERFSLGSWFSMDGQCRGSATWPEEKLPLWDLSVTEDQNRSQQNLHRHNNSTAMSETWGLVIVGAGLDGKIRTFHNYGLPVRL